MARHRSSRRLDRRRRASSGRPVRLVVNQGDDNVSQYNVGAGGLLAPLSPPTVAAGESSRSVTVSPDGRSAYVTNIGNDLADESIPATVSQYDIGADGTLSPKTRASVPMACEALQVVVSPDGKSAYFSGGPDCDRVAQYDVRPSGRLARKSPVFVQNDFEPLAVAVSPDSQSVYVANGLGGVSQYDVGAGGRLSPKSPATVTAGEFPVAVAVSPVPTSKTHCKRGGWRRFGFKSKKRCVHFVKRHARRECAAERERIGHRAFRAKYGEGKRHRHPFCSCVRQAVGAS